MVVIQVIDSREKNLLVIILGLCLSHSAEVFLFDL